MNTKKKKTMFELQPGVRKKLVDGQPINSTTKEAMKDQAPRNLWQTFRRVFCYFWWKIVYKPKWSENLNTHRVFCSYQVHILLVRLACDRFGKVNFPCLIKSDFLMLRFAFIHLMSNPIKFEANPIKLEVVRVMGLFDFGIDT